ncbi:ExeA family protein [Piscinibacter sakaiensis]|uniref:General secretion pathway protein A n=1 Tax=Piscinibacter sakaiensis TaxID=1547922 RepID=A0A0K8NZC5_PISS1|nr:AAA family ATPase [Piscinibacter sakaiensis]GAP35752.1 general secretion pathway protein A [Piscinibacter sakaiensis]
MYVQHFGLEHEPFSIAPDPRYLYLGEHHREALAHLLYGLGAGGGFVVLTGEIGAGKTTVCRGFLEQVPPQCRVAYVFNPRLAVLELLATVCEEFGVALPPGVVPTVKTHVDALNRFLLDAHAQGRHCVLLIDEAQQLAADVLEQLRLLTNLETHERKLLQIILVGQPELRELLAQPALEQLAQRVIARHHLGPLDEADTARYLQHRLSVAGLRGPSPLPPARLRRIHRLSGGVPRRINLLCDRALLGAYAQGLAAVDAATLEQAAREVAGRAAPPGRVAALRALAARHPLPVLGGALLLAGAVGAGLGGLLRGTGPAGVPAGGASALAAGAAASQPMAEGPAGGVADTLAAEAGAGAGAGVGAGAGAGAEGGAGSAAAVRPGERPALSAAGLRARLAAEGGDEAAGWQALAARWGARLGPGDGCAAAPAAGLGCYRGSGGLDQLRQLDRPALLWLRDGAAPGAPPGAGPGRPLLLVGLAGDRVAVQVGGGAWSVPAAALAAAGWRGDFATFWRAEPPAPPGLPADASPAERLAARLALWTAAAGEGAASGAADAAGAAAGAGERPARLAAFQAAQGLAPDGRAGPLTAMALNRATGVDEPRLLARPAAPRRTP